MKDSSHPSRRGQFITECLVVASFFLAILVFYFRQVVFEPNALLPADLLYQFNLFQADAPPGFEQPQNALLSDVALQFYPWQWVTREALEQGRLPFWNPYNYAGAPHFSNGQSAVLSPLTLMGLAFSVEDAFTFSALLRLLIAGMGGYCFLRAVGGGRFGSLVAGVSLMLSGTMIVWLNYPIGQVYPWLPWLLFFTERAFQSQQGRYWLGVCLVVALANFAGHCQCAFIIFLGWGIYGIFRSLGRYPQTHAWRQTASDLTRLAGAAILGVGLAAVQLAPFWRWLAETSEAEMRAAERGASWFYPAFWMNAVSTLFTQWLPNFFGNPAWGSPESFFFSNYVEQASYIGIIPLLLALFALPGLRKTEALATQAAPSVGANRHQLTWFFALGGLFSLLLAWRVPVIDLINQAPLFNLIAAGRYRLLFVFCLCMLAGFGAERLLLQTRGSPALRKLQSAALLVALAASGLLLGVFAAIRLFPEQIQRFNRLRVVFPILENAFRPGNLAMEFPVGIALLFACTLWLYRRKVLPTRWFAGVTLVLIAVDLYAMGYNFNPIVPEEEVFPRSTNVEQIQRSAAGKPLARVAALGNAMPPNIGAVYGLYDITGSEFPYARYQRFLLALGGEMYGHYRVCFEGISPRLLQLTSVEWLIACEKTSLPAAVFEIIRDDGHAHLYHVKNSLPRAYLVHRSETIPDENRLLERLAEPAFDPAQTVLLSQSMPFSLEPGSAVSDSVEILGYQPEQIVVQSRSAAAGILVLTDVNYPGWQATVDGQPAPIYTANYTFRAVALPAGSHEIVFTYEPDGFRLGLVISAATVVLLLLLGAANLLHLRRTRT